jgi:hypothetical protein
VSVMWPVADLDREKAWFDIGERLSKPTLDRVGDAVSDLNRPIGVKNCPLLAFWFFLDSMLLANQANREGMHANALALTRQCVEAMSVIEIGLSTASGAGDVLQRWNDDFESPGRLRKWLSVNAWPSYGHGLWAEPWADFMGKLAKAVQPYAHYSTHLAQWQERLHVAKKVGGGFEAIIETRPRAYDAQKATRITLFHSLMVFALARVWLATRGHNDADFGAMIDEFRKAIGSSRYLDGHETDWDQQFWAYTFFKGGSPQPLPIEEAQPQS